MEEHQNRPHLLQKCRRGSSAQLLHLVADGEVEVAVQEAATTIAMITINLIIQEILVLEITAEVIQVTKVDMIILAVVDPTIVGVIMVQIPTIVGIVMVQIPTIVGILTVQIPTIVRTVVLIAPVVTLLVVVTTAALVTTERVLIVGVEATIVMTTKVVMIIGILIAQVVMERIITMNKIRNAPRLMIHFNQVELPMQISMYKKNNTTNSIMAGEAIGAGEEVTLITVEEVEITINCLSTMKV